MFTSKNGVLETFGYVTYASMGDGYAAVTKGLNAAKGSGGALWASPAGSGAEPQTKSKFGAF